MSADIFRTPKVVSCVRSLALRDRIHHLIPGGTHTYAKGDDQFPKPYLPIIDHGLGCRVWDVDGNEYIEYAMGLRSVSLGHAYAPVVEAACRQMNLGSNFNRPGRIEFETAEQFLQLVPGADMCKFAKNGSDATTAALKLARAVTGREMVAICEDHPFFSVDDWFIGSTAIDRGTTAESKRLTVRFRYNDLDSLARLFEQYPGQIACIFLEPEKNDPPKNRFLHQAMALSHHHGALFVLDEMITGFRWHNGGAQTHYSIEPDLSTFGKAMGNGFAIAALAGKRAHMSLGGIDHESERVFLLSTTHGAESHALAATGAVMTVYQQEPVIEYLQHVGTKLQVAVDKSISEWQLEGYVGLSGHPACLVYTTCGQDGKPSQAYRTLFLQETLKRGIMAPSLVVSYSHTEDDILYTAEQIHEVLGVYRKAIDEGIEGYVYSRPVQPVYRKWNNQI